MPNGISIRAAAKALKKTPSSLLRWIRKDGAPCIREGDVGRGRGTIVDIDALQRWLAARAAPGLTKQAQQLQLAQIAESLKRTYRNDQAAASVGITDRQAAGVLVLVYERLAKDLTGQPVDLESLPAQMQHLCSIFVDSPSTGLSD